MKVAVLVKQVPDTGEGRRVDVASDLLDRDVSEAVVDEISERALEIALRVKDVDKHVEVVVVSMGPDATTKALRRALSMGADSAVHVMDDALAGSDLCQTAVALAAVLRSAGFDLIVAGNESTDGRGGVIPAMVAEHLGLPHLSFLNSVEIAEGNVSGERGEADAAVVAHASLPAVISVTERAAEPRFPNFKGIMTAKKKPLTVLSLSDIGIEPATFDESGRSVVVSTSERPARIAGTKFVDEGNAGVQLAEFLIAGRLI